MATLATTAATVPVIPTDLSKIDWMQLAQDWGAALAIMLIGMWLAKRVSIGLRRVNQRAKMDGTLAGFLSNVVYAVLLVVVFVAALEKIGVPMTSALAVLGTAGLAIGLSLKDSLSNIASGVMLIVLRPFRDGDYVQVAGQEGTVEEIRIFQTRLRTADNRLIVLPNSSITTAPIINITARPQRRIDVSVTLGLGDDLGRARELLLEAAASVPLVLKDPAPLVQVGNLGDANIRLDMFAWSSTPDYGNARSALLEGVRTRLTAARIATPVASLQVQLQNAANKPLALDVQRPAQDDAGQG